MEYERSRRSIELALRYYNRGHEQYLPGNKTHRGRVALSKVKNAFIDFRNNLKTSIRNRRGPTNNREGETESQDDIESQDDEVDDHHVGYGNILGDGFDNVYEARDYRRYRARHDRLAEQRVWKKVGRKLRKAVPSLLKKLHTVEERLVTGKIVPFFTKKKDSTAVTEEDAPIVTEAEAVEAEAAEVVAKGHTHVFVQDQRPSDVPSCVSCGDAHDAADLAVCTCSHTYCHECLTTLFKTSIANEANFPPHCCGQRIHIDNHVQAMPIDFIIEFKAKELEFGTLNRTYCHEPTCSAFLTPNSIRDDVGFCVQCMARTCVICKGAAHAIECPRDPNLQLVLQLASENGWQRCNNCHLVLELNGGCNHMTCTCGAEFCYVCGETWKTCNCPSGNAQYLYEEDIIENDNPIIRWEHQPRPHPMPHIRRHAGYWTQRREAQPPWCEICNTAAQDILFVCYECHLVACGRCHFYRLEMAPMR